MDNRASALENRIFLLIMLFVIPFKLPLVNAENEQLRQRLEKLLLFCLKISYY